jgi:GTP-dependent phosphoenolpyruvate carboxykinase
MIGYSLVYLSEERLTVSEKGKDFVQQCASSADIVIKVPVAVPYQNDWDAPEPVTGQIQHEGQFYQMKSQQLINDTLYVRCEVDQGARDRFTELVSKINDQVTGESADSQKGHHSQILKNFMKEYMSQGRKHIFYVLEWVPAQHSLHHRVLSLLPERHAKIPSPPPNLA